LISPRDLSVTVSKKPGCRKLLKKIRKKMRRNLDKLGTRGSQKCGIIMSLIMVVMPEKDTNLKNGSTGRRLTDTTPNYIQSLM
jgi:hypothetical protein